MRRWAIFASLLAVVAALLAVSAWSALSGGTNAAEPESTESGARPRPASVESPAKLRRLHVGASLETLSPSTLETWFLELPRAEDIPASADAHYAPPSIATAGERFGALVEAARRSAEDRAVAVGFFGRCAEDEGVLDGIRALCLHNWREYRTQNAAEPRADDRIRRIADFLPRQPGSNP